MGEGVWRCTGGGCGCLVGAFDEGRVVGTRSVVFDF